MNKKPLYLLLVLVVVVVLYMAKNDKKKISFNDSTISTYLDEGNSHNRAISNSNEETMKEILARIKKVEMENNIKDKKIASLQNQLNVTQDGSGTLIDQSAIDEIKRNTEAQIAQLKSEIEQQSNNKKDDSIVGGMLPKNVDDSGSFSRDNSFLPVLIQPSVDGQSNDNDKKVVVQVGSESNEYGADIVWIEADDIVQTTDHDGKVEATYPITFEPSPVHNVNTETAGGVGQDTVGKKKLKNIPMYTIPANSTLLNAVGLTAIIGRIPMSGTLTNPFRFKVLLGSRNLATNGLTIPNIESMVLSGTASGDFTMECAQGKLDKATFTFRDGTVRVVEGSGEKSLGWISDEYGTPCISGQYISNFMSYVTTIGSLSTMASIAEAISQSNVTTVTDGGSIAKAVNGNTLQYGLGQGVNDGVQEIIKWFTERQQSAFDAVFIPVGKKLTIHIEETLEIDYETEGRKLVHQENVEKYL